MHIKSHKDRRGKTYVSNKRDRSQTSRMLDLIPPVFDRLNTIKVQQSEDEGIDIRQFKFNGKRYTHVIFTMSDDRVELQSDGETILTYTNNTKIINNLGVEIGEIVLRNDHWVSISGDRHHVHDWTINDIEGCLDAEVEFSKYYLNLISEASAT